LRTAEKTEQPLLGTHFVQQSHGLDMSDPYGLGVTQNVSVVEQDKVRALTCMCIERGEKQFNVNDEKGTRLFTAVEDKDMCCQRCGCCCTRDFNLKIKKQSEDEQHEYLFYVPRVWCSWFHCCQCCRRRIEVQDKGGNKIGTVQSDCQCCACWPKFTVFDANGAERFKVQQDSHFCAQCLCCGARSRSCCGIDCYIPASLSINPLPSGKTTELEHQSGSRGHDADAFMLAYPPEASVNDKLLLVACTICVDYKMYTEPSPQKMKDTAAK
jgi:hypothetical protein